MAVWNPWRGCRRCSEGCRYCYIHKGDRKRGTDTEKIVRTDQFYAPIAKKPSGEYKMKPGQLVYVCFSSDFLIGEADEWRQECWAMIKERSDLRFLFLTKRIERFRECVPPDWNDGYENVTIRHKNIICQPLIERIHLEKYLDGVELVVAGGESDPNARPLDYDWILDLRRQCIARRVHFEFRQLGTHFIKDGKTYHLRTRDLCSQAKKADINV